MPASTAVLAHEPTPIDFKNVVADTAEEISSLLMSASRCADKDEMVAIDLMKRASNLLKPFVVVSPQHGRVVSGSLRPRQINRVKGDIEQRVSHPISLNELAQVAQLSTGYFFAPFKISFNTSPHNYVIGRSFEFAKHRMLNTNAPVCEIALVCGLADQARLSRIFRRVMGTPPSACRRQTGTQAHKSTAA